VPPDDLGEDSVLPLLAFLMLLSPDFPLSFPPLPLSEGWDLRE
jgi:hypothetical protein